MALFEIFSGFGIPFLLMPFLVFLVFVLILWIWAIFDCVSSSLRAEEKLLWLLIILLAPLIGAILYFILARNLALERNKSSRKGKGQKGKILTRDSSNKIIAGVCSGIAKYFDIDPTLVRLLWVVVTVLTGFWPSILIYLVAWAIMPEK